MTTVSIAPEPISERSSSTVIAATDITSLSCR